MDSDYSLDSQTLLQKIDSEITDSQPFNDLTLLMKEIENNNQEYMTQSQSTKMQNMVNLLFGNICKIVLSDNDSNVFHLINQSIARISRQNKDGSQATKALSPHPALDNGNSEKNIIKNLNNYNDYDEEEEIVNRIADQLMIDTPTTETDLVKAISEQISKAEQLKNDLIKAFDLPKNTHTEYVVTALQAKFDDSDNLNLNENPLSNEELQKELADAKKQISLFEEQMKILQDGIQKKNSPNNKSATSANATNDANTELFNKKIELAKVKSEYESLKTDNADLSQIHQQTQMKLEKVLSSYQELQEQNEQLTRKLKQANNDIEDLEKQPNEYFARSSNEQMEAFDKLAARYEEQSQELNKESNVKMQLISLVQKSATLNLLFEKKLTDAEAKIEQLEKSNSEIMVSRSAPVQNNALPIQNDDSDFSDSDIEKVDESLIDSIKTSLDKISYGDVKNACLGICNNDNLTISRRILTVVSTLTGALFQQDNYSNDQNANDEQNELLLNTLGSLLNFISTTAQTKEVSSWLLSKYTYNDAVQLMSEQVAQIQSFIKQQCIDIRNDQTNVFNSFINTNDPFELDENLRNFISKYDDVRTKEGKCLFVILQQALAAGMLLETFGRNASLQSNAQSKELSKARRQLQDLQRDIMKAKKELLKYQEAAQKRRQLQTRSPDKQSNQESSTTYTDPYYDYTYSTTMYSTEPPSSPPEEVVNQTKAKKQAAKSGSASKNAQTKSSSKKELSLKDIEDSSVNEETDANMNNRNADVEAPLNNNNNNNQPEVSLVSDEQYVTELQKKLEETRQDLQYTQNKLDKYKNVVLSVKRALRNEFLNGNQSPTILESFNKFKQLEQSSNEMTKTEAAFSSSNPKSKIQARGLYFNQINEDNEDGESKVDNEIIEKANEKVRQVLDEREEQLEKLTLRLQEAEMNKTRVESILKNTEISMNDQIAELESKLEQTVNEYEGKIATVEDENEKIRILLSKVKEKAQEKYRILISTENETKKKLALIIRKQKKKIQQLKQTIRGLRAQGQQIEEAVNTETSKIGEIERSMESIRGENEEMRQKIKLLQVENKLNLAKLSGKEDELKREKILTDQQWKIQSLGLQATAQSRIDEYKRLHEEKMNEFFISVSKLFKEYVKFSMPMTFETVFGSLMQLSEILSRFAEQVESIDRLKRNVGDKNEADFNETVSRAIQQNEFLRSKQDPLIAANSEYKKLLKAKDEVILARASAKDWENWALPFYKKLVPKGGQSRYQQNQVPSSFILRSVLGDALRKEILQSGEKLPQKKVVERPLWHLCIDVVFALRLMKLAKVRNRNFDPSKVKYSVANFDYSKLDKLHADL